ncbi:MAG: response regulator [bacterium]|nr:response regulator [bacterium]
MNKWSFFKNIFAKKNKFMGKKILVVEDEKILANAIADSLRSDGYEIDIATDGLQAVDKLSQFKPDLILLDIILPEMPGTDVLKKIRDPQSPFVNTPVFVFTNLSGQEESLESMGLKVDAYIVKANCSLEELSKRVKEFLS